MSRSFGDLSSHSIAIKYAFFLFRLEYHFTFTELNWIEDFDFFFFFFFTSTRTRAKTCCCWSCRGTESLTLVEISILEMTRTFRRRHLCRSCLRYETRTNISLWSTAGWTIETARYVTTRTRCITSAW